MLSGAGQGSNGKPGTTPWQVRDPEWCSPMGLPARAIPHLPLGLLGLTEEYVLTALPGKVIPYPAGGYMLLKVTCRLALLVYDSGRAALFCSEHTVFVHKL